MSSTRNLSLAANGFSLIEVLVVSAVLAIVSLGLATMISNLATEQKMIQARQDLTSLANEFQLIFSNPTLCESSIPLGTRFDPAKASVTYPPTAGMAFQFDGSPFRLRINQELVEDGARLENFQLIANKLQIVNAISAGTTGAGHDVYKASVIGQFSPQHKVGVSDFNIRTLVSGYVWVTNGTISGCSGASPTSTLDTVASLCPFFNGVFENGKCNVGGQTVVTGGGLRWYKTGVCNPGGSTASMRPCPATACSGEIDDGAPCSTPTMGCRGRIKSGPFGNTADVFACN